MVFPVPWVPPYIGDSFGPPLTFEDILDGGWFWILIFLLGISVCLGVGKFVFNIFRNKL